jgi:hypothetical protein
VTKPEDDEDEDDDRLPDVEEPAPAAAKT